MKRPSGAEKRENDFMRKRVLRYTSMSGVEKVAYIVLLLGMTVPLIVWLGISFGLL